ncbi:MAG: hypothetical protein RLN83_08560 [Balneola sp.]
MDRHALKQGGKHSLPFKYGLTRWMSGSSTYRVDSSIMFAPIGFQK